MSSPTMLQDKQKYAQTHAPEPEPDVTVHDDVDDSAFARPSHDEIAVLAYSYWIDSGQQEGSADEHWLRAERELKARQPAASPDSGGASETASPKAATTARRSQPPRSGSSQK